MMIGRMARTAGPPTTKTIVATAATKTMTISGPTTLAVYPSPAAAKRLLGASARGRTPNLVPVLEPLKPILRAAAVAAFLVGTVLFLINPPSLSGAGELVGFLAGAVALVLATAWATVTLGGRRGMNEPEFDRFVERSERLAERSTAREPTDFEQMVGEAIDRLPEEFRELARETPVVVSHRGREAGAYGHYFGGTVARGDYEDRIVVYQDTLERDFGHDPELLGRQIERTLRHELAHHLGWDEHGVRGLGL
jgi:predicted Zn-dependent protease with MMP-like domain